MPPEEDDAEEDALAEEDDALAEEDEVGPDPLVADEDVPPVDDDDDAGKADEGAALEPDPPLDEAPEPRDDEDVPPEDVVPEDEVAEDEVVEVPESVPLHAAEARTRRVRVPRAKVIPCS
jgi:hypothetical protein